MKRVYVIDQDNNLIKKAKLKHDKKNNAYYLHYSTVLFTYKVPVPYEYVDRNLFVVKDRKAYAIDLNGDAKCVSIDHLKQLLTSKVIANLIAPGALDMLIFIILGAAIGIGIGFMIHAYAPPPLPSELKQFLNATINATAR